MNFKFFLFIFCLVFSLTLKGQNNAASKLKFNADFRFRAEQDWNSQKPDGSFRDNRSRLRYRVRAGFNYNYNSWASFGARIRTGNPIKQQDPQLTLGDEFNILPIGFEKIYFNAEQDNYKFWIGKNTFPFEKLNELFWSDNVYPEGVFIKKKSKNTSSFFSKLNISAGHFILKTNGTSFNKDSYFQGIQISTLTHNKSIKLFTSFYNFKNIPNIPDGNETFTFNYAIVNIGSQIKLSKKTNLTLETDYYANLKDYSNNNFIEDKFKNEKNGIVTALSIGHLKQKKDWKLKATFSYMERYAAVDFLAQNDWARWDYSNYNSPDGRLTNFKGIELVANYLLEKNIKLTLKYYKVKQILPFGVSNETGDRLRLDLDIKI
ncbi:putative porin [Algibacter sp. PT7-4]|uniref:putative porin n=1 Tax=Algibacter ulvanivorans TaxID=3400999 RepID=UPI003AAC517F